SGFSSPFSPSAIRIGMPPATSSTSRLRRRGEDATTLRTAPNDLRAIWRDAFRAVRAETERRAAPLSAEDQLMQSMADASPTKWHRAHTTWFFEQFLLVSHLAGYRIFDEQFAYLFNSYYVAAAARPARVRICRPAGRHPSHRFRGRWIQFRQRGSAACNLTPAGLHRSGSRHERAMARFHGRRRLCEAIVMALRRLGNSRGR